MVIFNLNFIPRLKCSKMFDSLTFSFSSTSMTPCKFFPQSNPTNKVHLSGILNVLKDFTLNIKWFLPEVLLFHSIFCKKCAKNQIQSRYRRKWCWNTIAGNYRKLSGIKKQWLFWKKNLNGVTFDLNLGKRITPVAAYQQNLRSVNSTS